LDTLDTRIFRELVQDRTAFATSDIRRSFKAVAKKLNIDEVTVRKRIAKMKRSGFLQGWTVMANPTLVGLRLAQISFDVPSLGAKPDLVEQLKLMQGSFVLVDCFGTSLFLSFLYRDEESLQKQVELVRRMSKATNLVCQRTPIPESRGRLTETDWGIVRALQQDPRKSYGVIGAKLGVSSRTVRRRLQRMIENRAIFILPSMNPAALEGVIQADLLVSFKNPESKTEIDQKIMVIWADYLARAEVGSPETSFFNLFIKNVSQAQEVLQWVSGQPGVKNSRVDLIQKRFELYTSLNTELERKLQGILSAPIRSSHK